MHLHDFRVIEIYFHGSCFYIYLSVSLPGSDRDNDVCCEKVSPTSANQNLVDIPFIQWYFSSTRLTCFVFVPIRDLFDQRLSTRAPLTQPITKVTAPPHV